VLIITIIIDNIIEKILFTIITTFLFYHNACVFSIKTAKDSSYEKPFAVDVGCEREGYGVAFATFIKSLYIGG
jgi:hypothetical protein